METNVLTLTEMYQKENGIEADDNQRFKGMCIKYFSLCSVYVQSMFSVKVSRSH